MCRATVGAPPVWALTCAASATFSYGSRGTPACGNTLNRVPEFPKAHEGSSMRCARSPVVTAVVECTIASFEDSPCLVRAACHEFRLVSIALLTFRLLFTYRPNPQPAGHLTIRS